jgi:hypothetical protein
MRKSEELSMTTQPALAALGAYSLVASEPIAKKAMSQPAKSKLARSWVASVRSPKEHSVPRLRRLASAATSSTGNSRSARMFSISRPTLPVAPTTAMR